MLSKKKCKDKAKWVATKEDAMIATLLTRRGRELVGIRFQSSGLVLVVTAVAPATAVTTKKDLMQCKTAITGMSSFLSFSHWLTSQALFTAQGEYKAVKTLRVLAGRRDQMVMAPWPFGLICQGNVPDASVTCF